MWGSPKFGVILDLQRKQQTPTLNEVVKEEENLPSPAQNLQTKGEGKSPGTITTEIKLQTADPQAAGEAHFTVAVMRGRGILCWREEKA